MAIFAVNEATGASFKVKSDHSLIPVTVKAGQDVTGIDVCDEYGPPPPAPPK
jgi:hypothetical protein